jgi:PAS domain S-box-containing protein
MASNDPMTSSAADRARSAERLAYLAAVVDTSSDAILSKALDGTITSWNASAERIFGFTAAEMIGQNIRRLIPPELQAEEDEILAKLRAGLFIDHFETVRMTKDGRRLNVSLSISPIRNAEGEVVGATKIARDVTARKQADEQLAAATAKFESVFNQSGIFAGILDLDGNLREINHLALDECGYTREQVLDRPFWATPWWRGSADVQARIRGASEQAAAGGSSTRSCRTGRPTGRSASSTSRCTRSATSSGRCGFCTRPGSTSPTGPAPRRRFAPARPRSTRSPSGSSARCCPIAWPCRRGSPARPATRRGATSSRWAGTGTTPSRSPTGGSP